MLNKAFLMGRLVADPELRHTQNSVAVASFRIAVDRDFKDRETGEKKADFFSIVAWRQTAEFVSRYFSKGRMAVVEGRLQAREYTDRDGNRRFVTEVVADNVYFGDSKKDGDSSGNSYGGGSGAAPAQGSYGGYNDQGGYGNTAGGYGAARQVNPGNYAGQVQFGELDDDEDGELPF